MHTSESGDGHGVKIKAMGEKCLPSLDMKVIAEVMHYLNPIDYKVVRLTSHLFNEAFKKSLELHRFQFTIDGSSENYGEDCIQTFLYSKVPWRSIQFLNMDIEEKLTGHAASFDRFCRKTQNTLTSLKFKNCSIHSSRFTEILARFTALKTLNIINTDQIFQVSPSIINWAFLIPYFCRTLKGLKRLTLRCQELNIQNIDFFLRKTENLILLDLQSAKSPFPPKLFDAIKQKKDNLKHLALSGVFTVISSDVKSLKGFNLISLTLDRFVINDATEFANRFLNQQKRLRRLALKNMNLDWSLFLNINKAKGLEEIVLANCTFDTIGTFSCLAHFQWVDSLKSVSFLNLEGSNISQVLVEFFGHKHPSLRQITLEGNIGRVMDLIQSNCTKLSVLVLDSVSLSFEELQCLWSIKSLTGLGIRSCQLTDELTCQIERLDTLTLCDLQNLKDLDLSFTQIGDGTVENCIIHLQNLENLNLSHTKISDMSLTLMASCYESNLPNLNTVQFYGCPACEFSEQLSYKLQADMNSVNFFFDESPNWTKV